MGNDDRCEYCNNILSDAEGGICDACLDELEYDDYDDLHY